jgi:undecaprenyl-diphosphatase
MEWLQLLILAVVQGITEFLPISSSAHLVITPYVFGWADQGPVVDVALHVGTLLAVVVYFWRDSLRLLVGGGHVLVWKRDTEEFRLLWRLLVATLPLLPIGLLLYDFATSSARSLVVIGLTTIIFGLLLWLADKRAGLINAQRTAALLAQIWPARLWPRGYRRCAEWLLKQARHEKNGDKTDLTQLHWPHALLMGVFQAIALIPGTSRSGITLTAGRLLGFDRTVSARFATLMALPTITLALLVSLLHGNELSALNWATAAPQLLLGMALAFIAAWLGIFLLMTLFRKIGYLPFVYYRLALGTVLLVWGLFG